MEKLFFLVSGEFESLSFSELLAILDTEGYCYKVVERLDQTLRLLANVESVAQVMRRSAYTRVCSKELFTCEATDTAITEAAKTTNFSQILTENDTFGVRIRRIKEYATKEATMHTERLLGKLILEEAPQVQVNLKNPKKTFFGILTNGRLIFGLKLGEIVPKQFVERRARKKPYFHPSAMNAKLARCMVNMAHARTDSYVLDPFCGTGTAVIESALIGCKAVGLDVQRKMAKGALKNIRHFSLNPEGIILADARSLPVCKVDCVVTDPPYGRSATTLGSNTKTIVEAILVSAHAILAKGQRICIALPIKVNRHGQVEHLSLELQDFVKELGYSQIEAHVYYIHRSLSREIVVYMKNG